MKVLVAYMSQTGNTKKVAEAIYDVIPQPKEIKRVKDVKSLDDYDLSFLGFPMHGFGPDKQVKNFLGKHVRDRKIALFVTHMAPMDAPPLQDWIKKFQDAAVGAEVMGVFDCQGQVSWMMKTIMRIAPDSEVRSAAREDTSQGQPDAASLERARIFAKDIINKFEI
jgi:flavodoxin